MQFEGLKTRARKYAGGDGREIKVAKYDTRPIISRNVSGKSSAPKPSALTMGFNSINK